ncbi:ABC transporter permease [Ferruginibacter sp. SUN106]|uniref:ABC transporter permease n=1 Tax=Ferruginibacter sp. SUN106 TaxID=2978348 RepID=UPI003D3654F6
MFKNYLKVALRSILKNKVTGFINIFGLSVGMTASVFIFLWVQNESNFDNYHPERDNIYRVTNAIAIDKNEKWTWEASPMLLADAAKKEIPGVEKSARIIPNFWGAPVLNIDHKLFAEKTSAWVDKSWFSIFHYDFIAGSPAAFGSDPFSIILTESKAKKYFGDVNPVGQTVLVDTVNYKVQAVIKDNPVNSSFQFDILLQMDGRLANPNVYKNDLTWNNFNYITFLQLKPATNTALVATSLNAIIDKHRTNDNDSVSLQSLKGMYFESDLQSSDFPHGNKKITFIFTLLGLLLLVIACINYVNLTTAKASLRAKEVSMRKILGAQRQGLFFQFIIESLTISIIALIITIVLIKLCLPVFNVITEINFTLPLSSLAMWKVLGGTLILASVLNGLYPAALLSSFKPLSVFRGVSILKLNDGIIRKGLVIFQFSLSVVLIMATIVIYRQLHFIQSSNPGYNVSQVMAVQIPYKAFYAARGEARKSLLLSMKQELQSQSSITAVSMGGSEIIDVTGASSGSADWDGHDTTFNPTVARLSVDAEFEKMFDLKLQTGRWFKPGKEDEHNYILNETAATVFNINKPVLGQRFTMGGDTGKIIAVVKDFHYKNMHEKIGPLVISNNSGSDSYIFIKTSPGNISKAVSAMSGIWTKYIADQPFSYTFLDDSFARLYKADIKTSQLIFIFSLIAVIICALGLFGLAAFTAERRIKEIGIRKVLGASVQQITALLSKDFVVLVAIAIIIASPIAWWVMNKWLQDFAYRINISWWIFGMAGGIAIIIALVTVSYQAIKAAIANPVKSLRTE